MCFKHNDSGEGPRGAPAYYKESTCSEANIYNQLLLSLHSRQVSGSHRTAYSLHEGLLAHPQAPPPFSLAYIVRTQASCAGH